MHNKTDTEVKKAIEKEIRALEKLKKSKFDFTPEGKALSKNFSNNKGRLIWPVEKGESTCQNFKRIHNNEKSKSQSKAK